LKKRGGKKKEVRKGKRSRDAIWKRPQVWPTVQSSKRKRLGGKGSAAGSSREEEKGERNRKVSFLIFPGKESHNEFCFGKGEREKKSNLGERSPARRGEKGEEKECGILPTHRHLSKKREFLLTIGNKSRRGD